MTSADAAKAYVVTDGCYSDYQVLAVFLSKEDADSFVAEYGYIS